MNLLSIDIPSTYVSAAITIVGEKGGKDEALWRVCPRCNSGSTNDRCRECDLATVLHPEGFVGRSGNSLAQMCRAAGITAYNKSNVVKCVDGGFTSEEFQKNFYETVEVAQTTKTGRVSSKTKRVIRSTAIYEIWIDRLRAEIQSNLAHVVVAAGNEALYALTGVTGIENYRGSVLESNLVPGLKVIPIIHPAAMFHGQRWEYYYVTISDLKRAKRESQYAGYKPVVYPSIIWPKWNDITDFIGLAMQDSQRWCLDLETRAGSIACIGLSCGTSKDDICTLVIPIQLTTGPYWKPAEEMAVYKLLATLMRRNPNLVGQNLFGFDLDWLLDLGCEPSGVYMDTMSAFAFCYPELPKSLDFIVSLLGSLPYYKMESKTWNVGMPDEQLFTYNTKDTFSTLEVSFECEDNLKAAGLWDLYNHYILPVHWMALEIQKRRIPVSVENRETARRVVMEELERVALERYAMIQRYEPELAKYQIKKTKAGKVGAKLLNVPFAPPDVLTAKTFNTGSPIHMQTLVYRAMKLPHRHDRKTKGLTTGEEALMDLIAYYPEKTEDLKLLLRERHTKKALDYVNYKIEIVDGVEYLSFAINFPGTKSFRFSMSRSPRGFGFNAQTPPRWSRFQYIPPPKRVFIARDLSQVEARIVAALAGCKRQLERFADPDWSIHKDLGKIIYGEIPGKDTPRYTAAKSGVHGGNFREGPLKMARSTGAPLKETRRAVDSYHRTYPEIRQWHDWVRRAVINKGQLTNPFGFRRIFYKACGHLALQGVLDDSEWNEACSAVPQSVPPFLVNTAIIKCMAELPWVWFHHQGHDSYLASVPMGRAIEADAFLADALRITMHFDTGVDLLVPSEAMVGYTWQEMMPLGNMEPTYGEWLQWREAEMAAGRGRSRETIIQGINGIL